MLNLLVIILIGLLAAGLVYWFVIRPWHLRWGATNEELILPLPGDQLLPRPKLISTRAITINAPASEIWPWLAQIGQNRGGFYSYTWLENLVGCHMRNADRIVPEWQDLKTGDPVWLHPKTKPLEVTLVEPGRTILLAKGWAFALRPIDDEKTRLIVRSRAIYSRPDLGSDFLNFIYWHLIFEPAHFIMERKMMLDIKKRAESARGFAARTPQQAQTA